MYKYDRFVEGIKVAQELIKFGGAGHTSVLYTDETNQDHILKFPGGHAHRARAGQHAGRRRAPSATVYNFKLPPSLTLGCGSWGGNSSAKTSE